MDLGFFLRRGFTLASWLVLPPAVVAGIYFSVIGYSGRVERQCHEKLVAMAVFPDLREQVTRGEQLLFKFFPVEAGDTERVQELRHRLTVYAGSHQLKIRKLSISGTEERKKDRGPKGGVLVELGAIGNASAVMGFLNELQQPEYLVTPLEVQLNIEEWGYDPVYEGKFLFRFFGIE